MGLSFDTRSGEARFAAYVEVIASVLGHADRGLPFRAYCAGLLLPGERKSVEPTAARVEPGRVRAAHQLLHHFVAKADWSDEAVLGAVRAHVQRCTQSHRVCRSIPPAAAASARVAPPMTSAMASSRHGSRPSRVREAA